MTSFRYPVTVERRTPGHWNGPAWVPGALAVPTSILATVQPAVLSDYDQMAALPEGRRVEGMIRIYTDEVLQVAGENSDADGDLITWPDGQRGGRKYEIVARSPWQSKIIPHYRYLAALMTEPRT